MTDEKSETELLTNGKYSGSVLLTVEKLNSELSTEKGINLESELLIYEIIQNVSF